MNCKHLTLCAACFGLPLGLATQPAVAQESQSDQVSREEYESLKREMESMRARLQELSEQSTKLAAQEGGASDEEAWKAARRAELRLDALEQAYDAIEPGFSNFHLAGFGFTRFTDEEGEDSTFTAQFVPVLLWEVNDQLLFEAEIEFELEGGGHHGETHVELEYAHGSYIINDYMTFGAGKFLTPFGIFPERLHPQWINKLPNGPFAFAHDGIAPFSSVGAYMRGGFGVQDYKFNYAVYLSNGPALNTRHGDVGALSFENFEDINNNKAVGGRIGFLPIPELEIGYSFLFGGVNPTGDDVGSVDAFIQGIDVSYIRDVDFLAGLIDLRFEYVNSDVDRATYDPDGSLGFGPLTFNNRRDGFYVQAAYRPIHCDIEFLRNIEFVGRYDELNLPSGAPEGHDHERWTLGVNYYLNPSSMFKVAYQSTDVEDHGTTDAFMAMFVVGF